MSFWIRIAAATLLPVLAADLLYVLTKKTRFGKAPFWLQQVTVGLIFGALACLATQYGIPRDGYVLNVRSADPLVAGLVFGGPAGIIAGTIGALYRWFSVLWGVPSYTRLACSLATLLAGIIAALCRKYMFDKKRTSWFYGMFIGVATEVLHMLLVFVTHMDDIVKAFEVVRGTAVIMIAANGISVLLSLLFVAAVSRSEKKQMRPMTQTFAVYLFISILVAFLATSSFTYKLENNVADLQISELLAMNIEDVEDDVSDEIDRDLLTRTQNIAASVNTNTYFTGGDSLEGLRNLLIMERVQKGVSEISVIGPDGHILVSTDPRFDGFDMASNPEGQAHEFLCLLHGTETYVQAYQPMDSDPDVLRKYAGVVLREGYFLQVGYDKDHFVYYMREVLENVASHRHLGQTGFLFILDPTSKYPLISAPENTVTNEDVRDFASAIASLEDRQLQFYEAPDGNGYFYMKDTVEGYVVVGCIPESEASMSRDISVYIGAFMQLVVFAVLFLLVFFLLKKTIVENIRRINASLAKITGGNLETQVDVQDSEEFASLSSGINTTVSRLKEYISEAEKRIDQELALAKSIQYSALPSVFPPFPNRTEFDLYAFMDTAKEVGGDFYDFYFLDRHHLAFLIADVSGKGIPAAMFMMTAKTMIKSFAESGLAVEDVFTRANEKLCESNEAGMFVTAWMGVLDLKTGLVKFANAGHNPPLVRHADGSFEYLKSRAGFVLAGMEGMCYRGNELRLQPGDELFLYTDGVTEAMNKDDELWGEDRLRETLDRNAALDAAGLCRAVKDNLDAFVGEAPQFDDITMLSLKFRHLSDQERKNSMKELTIEASVENIPAVTDFVDAELEALECPVRALMQINVAIDELFSNIAHYAYDPENGNATVQVEVEKDPLSVVITFIDNGKPFDPLSQADPDVTSAAESREIGGLGIFMVKKTMDAVEYEYRGGQNILKIKKNLK